MSHASSLGALKAEPNLTPLLDVVLQLLMFFMMCVNFVSEQVSEDVKLPVAQSARPMSRTEGDVLYLNLDDQGRLRVLGRQQPLVHPGEVQFFLKQHYADAARLARERGGSGEVRTAVVIRGHRDVSYGRIYQLLRMCKEAGYRRLHLRALTQGGE